MKISLHVILFRLLPSSCCHPVHADLDAGFESIRLFDPARLSPDGSPSLFLIPEELLRRQPELFSSFSKETGSVFLCLCAGESEPVVQNEVAIAYLHSEESFSLLFNRILDIFHTFDRWDLNFRLTLPKKPSLQELLSLSENILTYPMVILDYSCTVLAWLKKPGKEDPLMERILAEGYASSEILQQLEASHILAPWNSNADLCVHSCHLPDNRLIYSIICSYNGACSLTFCCTEQPDEGYVHLLNAFNENLKLYFKQEPFSSQIFADSCEVFLQQLLRHPDMPLSRLKDQLRNISGLHAEGTYMLARLRFLKASPTPLTFTWWNLKNRLPHLRPFRYEDDFFLLKDNSQADSPGCFLSPEEIRILKDCFTGARIQCGISQVFFSLSRLSQAADECERALRFGNVWLQKNHSIRSFLYRFGLPRWDEAQNPLFFHYEELSLFYFLEQLEQFTPDLLYSPWYCLLKQYDQAHHNNLCPVFACYLLQGRNIGRTAEAVYLHRNTVLGKVKKAISIMGNDLEDYSAQLFFILTWFRENR